MIRGSSLALISSVRRYGMWHMIRGSLLGVSKDDMRHDSENVFSLFSIYLCIFFVLIFVKKGLSARSPLFLGGYTVVDIEKSDKTFYESCLMSSLDTPNKLPRIMFHIPYRLTLLMSSPES
eukprot:sb/3476099/